MTDNPSNSDLYSLSDKQRAEGGLLVSDTPQPTDGLRIRNLRRPGLPFMRAADKPKQEPEDHTYNGQDMFSKLLINLLLMLTGILNPDKEGNNPLIGMISKAFGMKDDSQHSEFRRLQEDVKTRGRETVRQERTYERFDRNAAVTAARMGEPILGKNVYNSQVLELIGKGESGGDYNRVYGKAVRIDLQNMSLNDVVAWQKQYTTNGSPSSAAGKYQIIRKTLEGAMAEMGLKGDEKFDNKMQDRIAMHLLNKRGYSAFMGGRMSDAEFANSIAKEWASLKGANGRGAYDGDGLNAGKISASQTLGAALQDRKLKEEGTMPSGERRVMNQFAQAGNAQTQPQPVVKSAPSGESTIMNLFKTGGQDMTAPVSTASTTLEGMTGYKPRMPSLTPTG